MTVRALPVLDVTAPAPRRTAPEPAPAVREFLTEEVVLPRFHVWTLGCQMNRSDSEEMAGALLAAGCAEAPAMESADLVVINSCAIREAAEQKVIGRMGVLGELKRANPQLRVVLTGCSVRNDNASILVRRYPQVDLFLRPDQESELTARLGLDGATGRGAVARESRVRAWLPIIYGCDKTCTYCIVPFARGPERSRPFDDVMDEARALGAAGYRDVTLLGQNVNSYGHDLPAESRFRDIHGGRTLGRRLDLDGRPDFAAVLRGIDSIRTADGVLAIPRLRFVTSHPWDLTDRLIAAMAESPSVCEHLHLPVQAGDDLVLRRMGRQYTVSDYLDLVARLRAAIPGIALTTDVICGFSGESEEAFERTLDLLRAVRFDGVFAAAFSVRPGTPAARLADDVPREHKRRRLNTLLALQEGVSDELNRHWVGRMTDVLVEEIRPAPSHEHADGASAELKPAPGAESARLAGRNRENKLVHLLGPAALVGREVNVRIAHAGPYALRGAIAA